MWKNEIEFHNNREVKLHVTLELPTRLSQSKS